MNSRDTHLHRPQSYSALGFHPVSAYGRMLKRHAYLQEALVGRSDQQATLSEAWESQT